MLCQQRVENTADTNDDLQILLNHISLYYLDDWKSVHLLVCVFMGVVKSKFIEFQKYIFIMGKNSSGLKFIFDG